MVACLIHSRTGKNIRIFVHRNAPGSWRTRATTSSLTGPVPVTAVICLEGTRQGRGRETPQATPLFFPKAGARVHHGLGDSLRVPSALFFFEQ